MNKLKEKMALGKTTIGSFFELGSGTTVECMGLSGLDYLIVDMEHGPYNSMSSQEFFRTALLYNITPLARVEAISRDGIMKPLDAGAQGLIIPCVKTLNDIKKIVEFGKYAPVGSRGVAANAANGYWAEGFGDGGMDKWFQRINSEILLFPQCETSECLDALEDIAAVSGIDGIFVGPYDLSTSMGIAGQFEHPSFVKTLEHILDVCQKNNLKTMIYSKSIDVARVHRSMGFDSITYTMDAMVLTNAYKHIVAEILE